MIYLNHGATFILDDLVLLSTAVSQLANPCLTYLQELLEGDSIMSGVLCQFLHTD